ncbi:protein TolR [Ancylobacter sp. MQZ15Z-1]|uniref:Protein TolR n=1 Tax=Ancylobacter mangrovi TaxID=2972472 RepID=A0A9X2T8X2_9HYPH|nr:protein TolR [Ancylobacter mangrovi]MCS0497603.1 protein TolR [Ancylobacter mangrovi]
MGMSAGGGGGWTSRRSRRRGGGGVMSEINVTPMVDVMLVLLIIFMVAAPMLTVGVPLDLPQTQAQAVPQDNEPLVVNITKDGKVYLQDTEIAVDELVPKLQAIGKAGYEERIFVRADKSLDYGTVMRVMGRLSGAGFKHVALVSEVEQGS